MAQDNQLHLQISIIVTSILTLICNIRGDTLITDGRLDDGLVNWTKQGSPYVITGRDLIIGEQSTLLILPGVKVLFGPKLGLIVEGTLQARGQADDRILFGPLLQMNPTPIQPARIRLADGSGFNQGFLQLKTGEKWCNVCSEKNDWAKQDANMACQHLGFANGTVDYHLFNQDLNGKRCRRSLRPPKLYIRIEHPQCRGDEFEQNRHTDVGGFFACPGTVDQRQFHTGFNVCNHQYLVQLKCHGLALAIRSAGYWKGIQFIGKKSRQINLPSINQSESLRVSVSTSTLQHVNIIHAGVSETGFPVSALSAINYTPTLHNVRLAYNAYNGLNLTSVRELILLEGVVIEQNQGVGLLIDSVAVDVHLSKLKVLGNKGLGGRLTFRSPANSQTHWLCRFNSTSQHQLLEPDLPLILIGQVPALTRQESGVCELDLTSNHSNYTLKIDLLGIAVDRDLLDTDYFSGPYIEIWDIDTNRRLVHWNLLADYRRLKTKLDRNKTSIVRRVSGQIRVRFVWTRPKFNNRTGCSKQLQHCVQVMLQVGVTQAISSQRPQQFKVTDSIFVKNQLGGMLLVANQPTNVLLARSNFSANHGIGFRLINRTENIEATDCRFDRNHVDGLSLESHSGHVHINSSSFSGNRRTGLVIEAVNRMREDELIFPKPNMTIDHSNSSNYKQTLNEMIFDINRQSSSSFCIIPSLTFTDRRQPITHRIDSCELAHNQDGAIQLIDTSGSSSIKLTRLRLIANGVPDGNDSISAQLSPIIDIRLLTSVSSVALANSILAHNRGRLIDFAFKNNRINGSQKNPTVQINHNVFYDNRGGAIVRIHADNSGPVRLTAGHNFISHNKCGQDDDVIGLYGHVRVEKIAYNLIRANRAKSIVNLSNLKDDHRQEIDDNRSQFTNNVLVDNWASSGSTSYFGATNYQLRDNYFNNKANRFELTSVVEMAEQSFSDFQSDPACSSSDTLPSSDVAECHRADHQLDVRWNWWRNVTRLSSKTTIDQLIRIIGLQENLIADDIQSNPSIVLIHPTNNATTISVKCSDPNWWRLGHDNLCFTSYLSLPMTFEEAAEFCRQQFGAVLPGSHSHWLAKELSKTATNIVSVDFSVNTTTSRSIKLSSWIQCSTSSVSSNGLCCQLGVQSTDHRHVLKTVDCRERSGFFCQKGQ